MIRRTSHFSGHVQGVGFRYTVQDLAADFDVRGYVRNLPDGRVELVVEGDDGGDGPARSTRIARANGRVHQEARRDSTTSPADRRIRGFLRSVG